MHNRIVFEHYVPARSQEVREDHEIWTLPFKVLKLFAKKSNIVLMCC